MDFARARHLMVETQVRPNDVTDPALLASLRRVPREAFVPEALKLLAYSEAEIEAAPGRRLMRPRDLGKLLAAAAPKPGERALEIGGVTGYGAAVLAAVTGGAVALEHDPALSAAARGALARAGADAVTVATGPLAGGWPAGAPYDVIVLHGASEIVPAAWLEQLAEGGRLAAIVRQGAASSARLYVKSGGAAAYRVAFDAAAPIAPGLKATPAFTF